MSLSITKFAKNLKKLRQAKGLTQQQVASMAKIPQSHLSQIERGLVDIRLSSLVELVHILNAELIIVPNQYALIVQSMIAQRDYHNKSLAELILSNEDEDEDDAQT